MLGDCRLLPSGLVTQIYCRSGIAPGLLCTIKDVNPARSHARASAANLTNPGCSKASCRSFNGIIALLQRPPFQLLQYASTGDSSSLTMDPGIRAQILLPLQPPAKVPVSAFNASCSLVQSACKHHPSLQQVLLFPTSLTLNQSQGAEVRLAATLLQLLSAVLLPAVETSLAVQAETKLLHHVAILNDQCAVFVFKVRFCGPWRAFFALTGC